MPERSLLKLLPAAVCLVIFLAVLLIARSFSGGQPAVKRSRPLCGGSKWTAPSPTSIRM